jgi:glycosyltransferase involved in cell wall biosynthesis
MIVKDESQVITRCLASVRSLIDYWVIVDTGSTDGTQQIIQEYLKDIPGELYERPWKNFGESRTEALELARGKGDYLLFMDADDTLEFDEDFILPPLTRDLYNMWRGTETFSYLRPQLVKSNLPWSFIGVTHEYLNCDHWYTSAILEKVRYMSGDGGARSQDPNKFLKNVKLLEDALKKDPQNSRHAFYLAESYHDAGEKGKSLECYQRRIDMGGWEEEIFWSKLRIGNLLNAIGLPRNIVIEAYKDAHHYRPYRVEPVYYLAELYNDQRDYLKAYEVIKEVDFAQGAFRKDTLFNMDWMREYGLLFHLSICAYYLGYYRESLEVCDQLLQIENLPENWRAQAEINRTFPLRMIEEMP